MPFKAKEGTGGAIEFWESVSEMFKDNDHVFYELYNEPHNNTTDLYKKKKRNIKIPTEYHIFHFHATVCVPTEQQMPARYDSRFY